jgi:hypothetical protein
VFPAIDVNHVRHAVLVRMMLGGDRFGAPYKAHKYVAHVCGRHLCDSTPVL